MTKGSFVRAAFAALALTLGARAAQAQTRVLILTGIGQEQKYIEGFRAMGAQLSEAVRTRYAVADSNITWLGEDTTNVSKWYRGLANKENIQKAVAKMQATVKPGDQVIVVLIGHGGGDMGASRFSIPGPDYTADDYAKLFEPFSQQRLAFINLATGSGDMLAPMSGPNRVVITATKTGLERNESVFGRYFVDALAKDGADADKDGRVSLLEAFTYASVETKRYYTDAGTLMTEHAMLDDDGDKKGDAAPTGRVADGMLARRFFFDVGSAAARAAESNPALARLYATRGTLEEQVDALKRKKAAMTPEAYDAELEPLLLQLSRVSRDIRRMEGRGGIQ
jgi:hypothetical protein